MGGIFKICTGLIAKILDFAFAGYGLVCDAAFLKIIFRHISYPIGRCRKLVAKYREQSWFGCLYTRIAEKLAELKNLQENEKWYFRGR
jgi:hypothetical protein